MKNFIHNKLTDLRIPTNELVRYSEPHRYYHNMAHIETMVKSAIDKLILNDELFIAIVFHDIIYNPRNLDNEELSAALCEKCAAYQNTEPIVQAILETASHKPTTELSKNLCDLDLEILNKDYDTFVNFENKIFKEYQFVDSAKYKEARIEVLTQLGVKEEYINYVRSRKPNIGLYAGSFDPFHKGHYNILKKAEQIFDKVIIARGINPDKKEDLSLDSFFVKPIQFRQLESYRGFLTDFINGLPHDVTLIRGIRNEQDLHHEMTQYRYLQDMKPDIKMVNIFCDKKYEHVSSSSIRKMQKIAAWDYPKLSQIDKCYLDIPEEFCLNSNPKHF